MNLHLRVAHARLGFDLAAFLQERAVGTVTVAVEPVERFALHYRPTLSLREVAGLLEALAPLAPAEVTASSELPEGHDLVLWLGTAGGGDQTVLVHSDSAPHAETVCNQLTRLGYCARVGGIQDIQEDTVLWAGEDRFSEQLFRWNLSRLGFGAVWRKDQKFSSSFGLFLRDPEQASQPVAQRFAVDVACDDEEFGRGLIELLVQRGFTRTALVALTDYEAETQAFTVQPGPFTRSRHPTECDRLREAVLESFQKLGIDPNRFPVRISSRAQPRARLIVPLAAARSGRKLPSAGAFPERFTVTVVTDDASAVEGLLAHLREAGFQTVDVLTRRSILDGRHKAGEFHPGFAIAWNEAGKHTELADTLMAIVSAEMTSAGATAFTLRRIDSCGGGPTAVRIYFPVRGVADGSLLARLADPSLFRLQIFTPHPDGYKSLVNELRSWKFAHLDFNSRGSDPTIYYGAAPLELIDRLKSTVMRFIGREPVFNKNLSDKSREIHLYLPERQVGNVAPAADIPEQLATQMEVWAFGEARAESVGPFIEVQADRARIGDIWLPRRPAPAHDLAPHPSSFEHFCMDRLTAATLEHVATSVLLREPCLLEGETSTSKTSSVLYLAALLRQPIARINLNGQTDTGELIGRFVPQHLALELPLAEQELYAAGDLLDAETRMILEKARWENRSLTRLEVQQIMAREDMASHPWRWQDGLVPQALRQGWWVLLDEVNLAEPQILERLNSVLETDPSLVLTEYDNSVIGPGGAAIHPSFRIFATMNPAEYAGRSVLSPAYRDRWRGYRFVPRPGEGEFLDMLRLLVFGEQPDFRLHGHSYQGIDQEPRYHHLAALPGADGFLEALARFHVALEHAVGQTPNTMARIGGRRKERYVFTRRGLLSMLDYLSSPLAGGGDGTLEPRALRRALLRYYLGRLSTADDGAMVIQLLDAHGLGPNTWNFG